MVTDTRQGRQAGEALPAPSQSRRGVLNGLPRTDLLLLILTAFLALQFLIPARLVIGGLGAAGRPSAVIGFGLGLAWLASWFLMRGQRSGRQPVRWIIGGFFLVALLAYATGHDRGLPPVEARGSDRWLIAMVAACGLALAVADGLRDRAALDSVLRRLTHLSGVMAAVGVVQAFTGFDIAARIELPGLQSNTGGLGIGTRGSGDFARVFGTATHYIEFGVVLGMVTPIAIHYALQSCSRAEALRRWSLTFLIAAGVPLSISRSGTIALAVGVAVLALAWTWRTRIIGGLVGIVSILVFQAIQPGVLGTIRSLFTNSENDPSVQNRISDYAIVRQFVAERPLLGRGLGTFLPDEYILLDNQFLYEAVTTGILGVIAFALVPLGGYWLGRSVRLRGKDEPTRHLGQALAAALIVALLVSGTFDSLSFATFTGLLFLLVGAVGALWRIDREGGHREPQRTGPGDRVVATPLVARLQAGRTMQGGERVR